MSIEEIKNQLTHTSYRLLFRALLLIHSFWMYLATLNSII